MADSNGFRAEVTSNEPGVAPQDPASATINKPAVVPLPAIPVAPVAAVPPPPPAPAAVAIPTKFYPQPPPTYNYIAPPPVAVQPPPPPPPPPAYFPPRVALPAPVAAPVATPYAYPAPVVSPVAGVAKGVPAYPPAPAYYTNLIQGKGYVSSVRSYPSLVPPFAAVPPQFGYFSVKSAPAYPAIGIPL